MLNPFRVSLLCLLLAAALPARAEVGLTNCAGIFPGGALSARPTYATTPIDPTSEEAAQTAASPLGRFRVTASCKRGDDGTVFFALAFNHDRRGPDWVAYRLSKARAVAAEANRSRSGYFGQDPDVGPDSDNRGRFGDYQRGHMAPDKTFRWRADAQKATYTFANVQPQAGPLNGGMWGQLEAHVLTAATGLAADTDSITVISGPAPVPLDARRLPSPTHARTLSLTGHAFRSFALHGANGHLTALMGVDGLTTGRRIPVLPPAGTLPVAPGFFKVIYGLPGGVQVYLLPHAVNNEGDLDFQDFRLTGDDPLARLEAHTGLRFPRP